MFVVSSQVKYVAGIDSQLKLTRCPHSLAATLTALPSMSLIPFAPFSPVRQGTNSPWWVAPLSDLRVRWEWDALPNDVRFQKILAVPESVWSRIDCIFIGPEV